MGDLRTHPPVLPIVAIFGRTSDALCWARTQIAAHWGPLVLESPVFPFTQTTYYYASMGAPLSKQLVAVGKLAAPDQLIVAKHQANAWEQTYRQDHPELPEARPLNIDPGYLTEAKLVLATTKDRDHRLYLGDGIFAEVTLHYQQGSWRAWPWTYPDYQQPEYHEFLCQCRQWLREAVRRSRAPEASG